MPKTVVLPPVPSFDERRLHDYPYSTLTPRLERIRQRLRYRDDELGLIDPTDFLIVNRPNLNRSSDGLLGRRLYAFFFED